ncbi:unnamed protein product [Moneuplotes crassus]|uniref:Uncharacterized protein n=1 Tax=Euplotes crassus TaxID=5936 RepID=A0AAD2D182_EUPCR|nr:unnamed protein product [Moneuplotes crassus]
MNKRTLVAVIVVVLLLVSGAGARRGGSRGGYGRRSRSSKRSGSRSTGVCSAGSVSCVLVPVLCIPAFVVLLCGILCCWKSYKKSRERKQQEMIQKAEQDRLRKEGLEQAQIEEASRLEKLQKEQEDLTGFQNDISYNSHGESQQPQFIMPGTAIQPTYKIVNPYSGSHNPHPTPIIYDPSTYGVQYDTHIQLPQQDQYGHAHKESVALQSPTGYLNDRQKIVPVGNTEGSQICLIA